MTLDVLIVGGGAAGLWVLDELHRAGYRVLLAERDALGAGQTIASQGIIHGGMKYAVTGGQQESARSIREMPGVWRECLAGGRQPDLRGTRVRSACCHMWRTSSLRSTLAMVGARAGLRSNVEKVPTEERPTVLANCPGEVYRLDEQVIDSGSFLAVLAARHQPRIVHVEGESMEFVVSGPGAVDVVRLSPAAMGDRGRLRASPVGGGSPHDGGPSPDSGPLPDGRGSDGRCEIKHDFQDRGAEAVCGQRVELRVRWVILAAGSGNGALRERAGLDAAVMQRRPLHMVMVRGGLPELFGHCVDGARTRVTISTMVDSAGRTVWQVGGQVAEDGVGMTPDALMDHARRELTAVLPRVDLRHVEWSTHRIDRAEAQTVGGARPTGPQARREGNVITAWPTKLALCPRLAILVRELMAELPRAEGTEEWLLADWPRPPVARPPWERACPWVTLG